MHHKFLRSSTAVLTCLALMASHLATPSNAQSQEDAAARAMTGAAVADLAGLDERLGLLEARIKELQERDRALEAALTATTVAFKDQISAQGEALRLQAEESARAASAETAKALKEMAENTLGGDWTKDMPLPEVLAQMEASKAAAERLQKQMESSRDELNTAIRTTCPDLKPQDSPGLAALYPTGTPSTWSAEVVFRAKAAGLALPDCIAGLKNGKLADEYFRDQLAAQQSAAAMNAMMMMAISSGNPYIIAAAMLVMVLLSLLGDGGNVDGNGGREGGGQPIRGGGGGGSETVTAPAAGDAPQQITGDYSGVIPGTDVSVYVRGQIIKLVSTKLKTAGKFHEWTFDWSEVSILDNNNLEKANPISSEGDARIMFVKADLEADPNKSSVTVLLPKADSESSETCKIEYLVSTKPIQGIVAEITNTSVCN